MQASDFSDLYELEETLWWFVGMRKITAALLDPLLAAGPKRTILDAGCGAGGNLNFLERYANGGSIVGIDISQDALIFARRQTGASLVRASATHLPFPDSHFDLITSFDVLVQIPGESSDRDAIAEMERTLRPGGTAFVRVAAYSWMRAGHDRVMNTQRRYSLTEICRKLEVERLEIVRATYANTFLFPLAVVKRKLFERIRLSGDGSDVRPLPSGLRRLNDLFASFLAAEARILQRPAAKLPTGLSAICVLRKPG